MIDVYKNYLKECPVCGGDLSENDKDCPFCGSNLLGHNKEGNDELNYKEKMQRLNNARATLGVKDKDVEKMIKKSNSPIKRLFGNASDIVAIIIAVVALVFVFQYLFAF